MYKLYKMQRRNNDRDRDAEKTNEVYQYLHILDKSSGCEDAEFIIKELELNRCPYCLEYFGEDGVLRHKHYAKH